MEMPETYWYFSLLSIFVAFMLLGKYVTSQYFGFLIDERGKHSLSRFQLALWTVLICATLFSAGIESSTMNINIKPEIWALLGISLGSAASSLIVKSVKYTVEPDENIVPQAGRLRGVVHCNKEDSEASFLDMFKGEEATDCQLLDISKIQMFFITIAVWIGYAAEIARFDFAKDTSGVVEFPILSSGIIGLIGVSHVGYISMKASPKMKTKVS